MYGYLLLLCELKRCENFVLQCAISRYEADEESSSRGQLFEEEVLESFFRFLVSLELH